MRLAIMQPYFFPYIGYFSLIKHTDKFVLLDTVQFIRHGWIERNRVLKQTGGWLYIKVPIKKNEGRYTLIRDIKIDNQEDWKKKIISQLQPYKKIAPHYKAVIGLITDVFEKDYDDIVSLNKASMEAVCDYLDIKRSFSVFSEMDLMIDKVTAPDEWALNICKSIGVVDEYWNPEGGVNFFDVKKYARHGIVVRFIKHKIPSYAQGGLEFESNLSIIDVLMFNDKVKVNHLIDEFYFL